MREPADGEGFRALRDRAVALVAARGAADDEALLRHVFGSVPPPALRARLLAPLDGDPRLARDEDGTWRLAGAPGGHQAAGTTLTDLPLAALAVVATGPRPGRHRLAAVAVRHSQAGTLGDRFEAFLRPSTRVPRYVAEALLREVESLDDEPAFEEVAADLQAALAGRVVVALEADLAVRFLADEGRRAGLTWPDLEVLDLAALADLTLDRQRKPTLAALAARCGVGAGPLGRADERARVVALVAGHLLAEAQARGMSSLAELRARLGGPPLTAPLRDPATARALPDGPGVYALRGVDDEVLYVGKARRLRERLQSYTSRPLGPTRRLEGLADAVRSVEAQPCETEVEALVLEAREIARLAPRFNTARRVAGPRPTWLCLPPPPPPAPRSRRRAPPRILPRDPRANDPPGTRHIGPFRNAAAASGARNLARALFDLDAARRDLPSEAYLARLEAAWRFLDPDGGTEEGVARARAGLADASARRDHAASRRWRRLLAAALAYDPAATLLPRDPRTGTCAVVRPAPGGAEVEVYVLREGVLIAAGRSEAEDAYDLATDLLADPRPRTTPDDAAVVRRWLGGQRPPARVVPLVDDPAEAADAIAEAALACAASLRPFAPDPD